MKFCPDGSYRACERYGCERIIATPMMQCDRRAAGPGSTFAVDFQWDGRTRTQIGSTLVRSGNWWVVR